MAFDADVLGVHGLVGFEIIHGAVGAPRPGAQRAPIVGFARLALVDQTDNALPQTRAVVGLNAAGFNSAKPQPLASTCAANLARAPRPVASRERRAGGPPPAPGRPGPPPNTMITGTGPFALAGVLSDNWISTVISG